MYNSLSESLRLDLKKLFKNSFIFNSVSDVSDSKNNLWQHFSGIEIETNKDLFDENSDYNPYMSYGRSKIEMEKMINKI